MEDVFLFVLTLVGLLILWSLIRRIPSKNMKNFHIHLTCLENSIRMTPKIINSLVHIFVISF